MVNVSPFSMNMLIFETHRVYKLINRFFIASVNSYSTR